MPGLALGLGLSLGSGSGGVSAVSLVLDSTTDILTARNYSARPYNLFSGAASSKLAFDVTGTLAYQNQLFRTQAKTSSINVPGGQGGDVGEGFTCTGLAWDGTAFWIGNDGGNLEGDSSRLPSIVHMALDGTKLAEIDIGTLFSDTSSVQGVDVDADGTLWVVQDGGDFRHITTAGVNLANGFNVAGMNAVAYDSLRDELWTTDGTDVKRLTKAGVEQDTFAAPALADQVHYDAERDYIWVTYGANGSAGKANAYAAEDGTLIGTATFPDVTAIEGMVILNGNFYVVHDGYYHTLAVIKKNQLQVYPAVEGAADIAWAIDHNPTSHAVRGYLIEGAFTRLSDNPSGFGSWGTTNGAISANAVTAPNGLTEGDTLTANAGTFAVRTVEGYNLVAGPAFVSVIAKAGTYGYLWMGDRGNAAGIRSSTFNLSNGTVVGNSTGSVGKIEDMGGGWYRCWVEYTRSADGAGGISIALGNSSHTTDWPSLAWAGTETVQLWGGMGANAVFPGSLVIAQAAGGETRAAESFTLATSEWDFSATNNTLRVEGRTARGSGAQVLLQIDDGSEDNRLRLVRDSSNVLHFIVTVATVEVCNLNLGSVANSTDFKVAIRVKANDFSASLDGAAVVTDTSGALPTVTTLRLGHSFTGEHWNSTIKYLSIAPSATADADLRTLST